MSAKSVSYFSAICAFMWSVLYSLWPRGRTGATLNADIELGNGVATGAISEGTIVSAS
ncbi:hypothetical protein P691DRAFT_807565 [Macrolepiota fuliginosa MF-IS2]|uniref:Uncharacterized protein n=1 Tax=Macrolepiota fuliginosa MF-IS2 TaxID=1400762 RepID=A0A9P5X603_9AGAR|nr:hypothetical protein P691DRAFT_807565 [Macrolepiota fuliginosa MF-IS2]